MAETTLEQTLFKTAEELRDKLETSEYKYIVLGLVFLKFISDRFQVQHDKLTTEGDGFEEDEDEYIAENIFFIPKDSRWNAIVEQSASEDIGKIINNAFDEIEKNNDILKGVLPKIYTREDLPSSSLTKLIKLFEDKIKTKNIDEELDILGRVYEYFISNFASNEGKRGGEYYTPKAIVKTLVSILKPQDNSTLYEPCCGSGGMIIQSSEFIKEHRKSEKGINIYAQESKTATQKLCIMNLSMHSLNAEDVKLGNTLINDLNKHVKADYILANPPFNLANWGLDEVKNDIRWQYGIPPETNANYAWLQHIIHHLGKHGKAGIVLANGSMSTMNKEELAIRKAMLQADKVEAMISLPPQMFYGTQIPCCLWILADNKPRKQEVLFIDARELGYMKTRVQKDFTPSDIQRIADTYTRYINNDNYEDVTAFNKAATLEDIERNNYVLTPGRYVGIKEEEQETTEQIQENINNLTDDLFQLLQDEKSQIDDLKAQLQKLRI